MLHPSIQNFRLGLYAADYAEAYSFVRVAGPFTTMAHEDRRLEIIRPPRGANGEQSLTWDWILQCDAIFMYHPLYDQQLHCLATARRLGRPVWVELVDDVFNVPPHSPIYQTFKDKRFVRENTTSAIDLANVVTVTSQLLKEALVKGCDLDSTTRKSLIGQPARPNDKMVILPEAALYPPSDLPRKRCITWRGLSTHDEDVAGVLAQMCAVARDFPEWEWALFGAPSREFVEQLEAAAGQKNVRVSPMWPTPLDMFEAWRGCAPYLHLVPLADDAFNRSKSHLAYLEATAAGAAVIVPAALPEWQQPGVLPYHGGVIQANGHDNLEAVLRRELVNYPHNGKLHPNVWTARAAIYPERTLGAMNERRWLILNKLAGVGAESRELRIESRAESVATPDSQFTTHSQAGQDAWVHELLVKGEGLKDGTFLDIGCLCEGRPDAVTLSNTYALEQIGWRGLLVDIAPCPEVERQRTARFIQRDATKTDLLGEVTVIGLRHGPIDYLSLDVDEASVATLKKLLADGIRFRVATIEHDSYQHGPKRRDEMRTLLIAAGYTLLRPDVCVRCPDGVERPFEDWWIDAKTVKVGNSELRVESGKASTTPDSLLTTHAHTESGVSK